MLKKRLFLACLTAALLLSGCATNLRKADRTVRLTVEQGQNSAQFALAEPTPLTLSDERGGKVYCADLLMQPGCLFEYNTYNDDYSYIYMGCEDESLPVDFRLDVSLSLWELWEPGEMLCEGSRGGLYQNYSYGDDDMGGYVYQALLGETDGMPVYVEVEADPCDLQVGLWGEVTLPELTAAQLQTLTGHLDELAGAMTLSESVPNYQVQVGDVVYDPSGVGYRMCDIDPAFVSFQKDDDYENSLMLCPCDTSQLDWLMDEGGKPTANSNGVELYHHEGGDTHYYLYRGDPPVFVYSENAQAYKMFFPAE